MPCSISQDGSKSDAERTFETDINQFCCQGFLTGYVLLGTGWFGTTSAISGVAVQVQAYIIVANPNYVAERWHVVMVIYSLVTPLLAGLAKRDRIVVLGHSRPRVWGQHSWRETHQMVEHSG